MSASRRSLLASLALASLAASACTSFWEIPIEIPLKPKLDASRFERVLVAGFVAGGSEEVDGNLETVRLLRSQLRTKSSLRIIEGDVLPLAEVAASRIASAAEEVRPEGTPAVESLPRRIKDEKDLESFDRLFTDIEYWKKLGEEFQSPLIVTGTVLFTPHAQSGFVQVGREEYDALGRRDVRPTRTYMERKGFILRSKFVFIDGRTGEQLYSEAYREQVLYNPSQNTPPLSSYFELMDRMLPGFLSTLSSQKIRGTRVLVRQP